MSDNVQTDRDQEAARQWLEQMQACLDEAIQRFDATSSEQELARWMADPF